MPKKQASLKELGFVKSFIGSEVPIEEQNEILAQLYHLQNDGIMTNPVATFETFAYAFPIIAKLNFTSFYEAPEDLGAILLLWGYFKDGMRTVLRHADAENKRNFEETIRKIDRYVPQIQKKYPRGFFDNR